MQRELSETANFIRQAERNSSFEGVWPVAKFERLKPVLNSDQGDVHVSLKFGDRVGIAYLKGSVSAELDMVCQRCLQPMKLPVSGSFLFGLVSDEADIDRLPDDMEALLVEDTEQSLLNIVEDELLLLLPQVSAHTEECSEYLRQQDKRRQADKLASSPFAVLKNLMSDKT